ncbi:MAG: hypothetical protein ITG07_08030 [Candidimonas sp.]|nr:hypothetical protein [Candidimonas sp.]
MKKAKSAAGAASAAYRNVNKKLAKTVGIAATHSARPSVDFEQILDGIPPAMREMALEWYKRGIKRGIAFATDRVVDGTFQFNEDNELESPEEIIVRVRTKFTGEEWKRHEIAITPEDVGFT